jgi:hypothetical protein
MLSCYKKYQETGNPANKFEEYTSHDSIPQWATLIEEKKPVDLPQKIGTCACNKFIYKVAMNPETPDPNQVKDQIDDALYHCDGESYQSYFWTGENFGCVHFARKG